MAKDKKKTDRGRLDDSTDPDTAFPAPKWLQMNELNIARADTSSWIVVLPLGATEQHGPHLPVETDTLIAQGIVERVIKDLPENLAVTFLPAETIGYSPEHLDWKETKSLEYDEAIERWISIGAKLATMGIRKMVFLNAHGGNSPLMNIVATELRIRHQMLCIASGWTRFGLPEGLLDEEDAAIDIHGGFIETSIMLALHPEQVKMNKAEDFLSQQSRFLDENRYLSAYGRHGFGWKMVDLSPKGVVGNAKLAKREAGQQILNHVTKGFITLLQEADRFDMELFDRQALYSGAASI